jgi:hypothetical protein
MTSQGLAAEIRSEETLMGTISCSREVCVEEGYKMGQADTSFAPSTVQVVIWPLVKT